MVSPVEPWTRSSGLVQLPKATRAPRGYVVGIEIDGNGKARGAAPGEFNGRAIAR